MTLLGQERTDGGVHRGSKGEDVTDLAGSLGMKPQAVSNQLQRLSDLGIVASRREGTSSTTASWTCACARCSTKGCASWKRSVSAPRPRAGLLRLRRKDAAANRQSAGHPLHVLGGVSFLARNGRMVAFIVAVKARTYRRGMCGGVWALSVRFFLARVCRSPISSW